MQPDTFITTALYDTLVEHLALVAGNTNLIRNILRALPLPDHQLEALADRLAHLAPSPFAECVTDNEVKICLGEHGSVWPNSIKGAVTLANYEDMERH